MMAHFPLVKIFGWATIICQQNAICNCKKPTVHNAILLSLVIDYHLYFWSKKLPQDFTGIDINRIIKGVIHSDYWMAEYCGCYTAMARHAVNNLYKFLAHLTGKVSVNCRP